jgi:hypothetical protein
MTILPNGSIRVVVDDIKWAAVTGGHFTEMAQMVGGSESASLQH